MVACKINQHIKSNISDLSGFPRGTLYGNTDEITEQRYSYGLIHSDAVNK